jgi:uncharacterized protein (DUF433 family)
LERALDRILFILNNTRKPKSWGYVNKKGTVMRDLIVSNPKIMMGKPTINGTRITVELILEKLAAGESIEQILSEHPRLTQEAIQASCSFAAEALKADVIYPIRKI